MEYPFELQNKTRVPRNSGEVNDRSAPKSRENRNLGYILNFEKATVSYADFDSEIVENVKTIQQKQQVNGKGKQNEELIRYMSNLPSFLEKGKNVQERAFTVGVLDWRLLEKWQHSHNIGNGPSPSSSNTSSFSSTEGSSSRSSRGHCSSPACDKMQHPTLQSYLYGSPVEAYAHDSESSQGNDQIVQDLKDNPSGSSNMQKISQTRRSKGSEDSKGKMKIQHFESLKRDDNLEASVDDITDQSCTGKHKKIVLGAPKIGPENRCSSKTQLFVSTEMKNRGLKEARRRSFSNVDNSLPSFADPSCDGPRSFPPLKADTRHSQIEQPLSSDAKNNICSAELNQHVPSCGNMSVSSSRGKKLQEKRLITPSKDPIKKTESSEGSNLKIGTVEATKVRSHSPIRRFSISMGRIGKFSSSSVIKPVEDSSANGNKSKAKGQRSSSPLKWLLDPLIKLKAVNSDNTAGASLSDSTSRDRRRESASLNSVKMKLDLKHCKQIDAEDPHHNKKDKSSRVQALLQVAEKNGVPLFTFAVDNKSEILAATMKKLCFSEKDECSWLYTFFFIHETKKKNKDRGNGYVPNVVAQMKVTDDLTKQKSRDQSIVKEFLLFATDSRQADQKTTDLELNNELAAMVVKVPKKTTRCNGSSTPGLKESFQHVRASSDPGNNEEKLSTVRSEDGLSMTVIFPGGNHGVPIKGEPSSLIRRWKSGGSCDCGGWDLGCQLRVMADDKKGLQGSNSTKPELAGRFELFPQEEEVDQKPVFSLSPFKDGIYSVEFDSSVKVLQAFSISLAVLRCRKPAEFSETSALLRDKLPGDGIVSEADVTKVCSRDQVEIPVKYVSHPPLSPVGRA